MQEQRGMGKGQCIHAITGTGGYKGYSSTISWAWNQLEKRGWSHHTQPIYLQERGQVCIVEETSRAPGPV